MNKVNNQFIADYVYLAEASYTDFSQKGSDFNKLKESINQSFATLVTNNYTVLAHWKDRAMGIVDLPSKESGFSATLFQNNHTGKYVLAIKGSLESKDFAIADLADIVHDGLAHHQIIDLYNFWKQVTSPKSNKGYTVAVAETDYILTALYKKGMSFDKLVQEYQLTNTNYFIDTGVVKKIVFRNSLEVYEDERQNALGIHINEVTTTGHSLASVGWVLAPTRFNMTNNAPIFQAA